MPATPRKTATPRRPRAWARSSGRSISSAGPLARRECRALRAPASPAPRSLFLCHRQGIPVGGVGGSGVAPPDVQAIQPYAHGRAPPRLALDPELAAVGEHEVLDDREAETGAAELARSRLVDAVEPLGDPG